MWETILNFLQQTGFAMLSHWQVIVMIAIACVLAWLAIVKKFEPLLLLPIAFGMLLTNLPGAGLYHEDLFAGGHAHWDMLGGATVIDSTDLAGADNFAVLSSGEVVYAGQYIVGHASDLKPEQNAVFNADGSLTLIDKEGNQTVTDNVLIVADGNQVKLMDDGSLTLGGQLVLGHNARAVSPGLIDFLYLGVKLGIYPCLIFFGVGAMTDFGPLIANPKSLLLGAAAQLGIFVTFFGAKLLGFTGMEAGSIGIIGGADGPTAIFVASRLAPGLLGAIAVAAYSYMALVPVIQPPIMKLLTTKKERQIVMKELRPVSRTEKVLFPFVVTIFVSLLVPSAAPLVGSLMLGNLFKESGVTERLSKTVQNELMNIVTIFLGVSVGATATAATFLDVKTLMILAMGIVAFALGTAGGVLLAKFMNLFLKNKINPLIGSAGVSAVPMAARVSQKVGQAENPGNFLLMHAMGPNVAGVIGSAIAAGVMIALAG
ncbi:MAG: sodium ion-translocating decarboxylase subunit beta [Acutalibacteraceae bacterium]|jgi:sodium ion-translocating decarboxylase beta subunit